MWNSNMGSTKKDIIQKKHRLALELKFNIQQKWLMGGVLKTAKHGNCNLIDVT
jgi:hypothetical protein